MFECRDQKRSKSAAIGIGIGQVVLFQQSFKEGLRQVLCLMDVADMPPDVRIQRRPVRAAQFLQGPF